MAHRLPGERSDIDRGVATDSLDRIDVDLPGERGAGLPHESERTVTRFLIGFVFATSVGLLYFGAVVKSQSDGPQTHGLAGCSALRCRGSVAARSLHGNSRGVSGARWPARVVDR